MGWPFNFWPFNMPYSNLSGTKPCKLNSGHADYFPRLWHRNLQEQKRNCDKFSSLEQCAKCKLGVPSSLEAVAIDLGAATETTVAALILFSTEDKGSTYTVCDSSEFGGEVGITGEKPPGGKVNGKIGKIETRVTAEGALMAKFIVIRTGVDLKNKESEIIKKIRTGYDDNGRDYYFAEKTAQVCAQYSICVPVAMSGVDFGKVTDWSLDCVNVYCMACYIKACNGNEEFKPSYSYIRMLFTGEHVHIVALDKSGSTIVVE